MTANECMKSPDPCWHHRYYCVHTKPGSEEVYDHSQGTWDEELRGVEGVETFPSSLYEHGMTASQLRKAASERRPLSGAKPCC